MIPIAGIKLVTFRGQRILARENGTFSPGGARKVPNTGLDRHVYETTEPRLASFAMTASFSSLKEMDEIENGPRGTLYVELESGEVITIEEARMSVDDSYDVAAGSVGITFTGASSQTSGLP